MTKEDLSFVAEALLALCETRPESPYYSEDQLQRKLREAEWRGPLAFRPDLNNPSGDLPAAECAAVFQAARLTDHQAEVLNRRLEGWTFEEIGRHRGCSKQSAMSVFVLALKKLTRAYHVYPYVGLGEVYHQETRRGLKPGRFGTMR